MKQIKEYEYVDLGLPSGLKWAKCNVGAENETDYGDYFQWGSTTPNTDTICDLERSPFNGGNSEYNKEYFDSVKDTVCPNGVLAKEYDAASQIMGGDWRMPTNDEFKELLKNTTNEWITNYNGSGVNGRKFTSKINGNSIFIPASGGRSGSEFSDQGSGSLVWSSSLYAVIPGHALHLGFFSDNICGNYSNRSYYGFVIRGVMK